MKKTIIVIGMAIVIMVLSICLAVTNSKLNACEEQLSKLEEVHRTLLVENNKIKTQCGDLFAENIDYMNREEELNTALDILTSDLQKAEKTAKNWEECYARAYRENYEAAKEINDIHHSGVSLTEDNEYAKELEYNSKDNEYFGE